MKGDFSKPVVCPETQRGLTELALAADAVAGAFRAFGLTVREHRARVALRRLMWEHERQAAELRELVRTGAAGSRKLDQPQVDDADAAPPLTVPVPEPGHLDPRAILVAARLAEIELLACYGRHLAVHPAEPVRAVLSRHRRVIAAHVEWLCESGHWKLIGRVARLRELGAAERLKPAAA